MPSFFHRASFQLEKFLPDAREFSERKLVKKKKNFIRSSLSLWTWRELNPRPGMQLEGFYMFSYAR